MSRFTSRHGFFPVSVSSAAQKNIFEKRKKKQENIGLSYWMKLIVLDSNNFKSNPRCARQEREAGNKEHRTEEKHAY